jgi:hypothetical protein
MSKVLFLQPGYDGREAIACLNAAQKLGYYVAWGCEPDKDNWIPVGSVEYCEEWLGWHPSPSYYPNFLFNCRHRGVWCQYGDGGLERIRMFVKPGERYKAFDGRIFEREDDLPHCMLFCSEVVNFVQEWRYYVTQGKIVASGWYYGSDSDEPAPQLDAVFPPDWSGAADFGRLDDGQLALVECQHPYACGWYGDDNESYVQWLIDGWQYMKGESNESF